MFSGAIANAQDMPLTDDGRFPQGDYACGELIGKTFAKETMESRQSGVPISDIMKILEYMEDPTHELNRLSPLTDIYREMVIDAYARPRWNTKNNKQEAVENFINDWTLACYKAQ